MKLTIPTVILPGGRLPECHGNMFDLHVAKSTHINGPYVSEDSDVEFTYKLLPLGLRMTLPKHYRAEVKPRSSMFKNTGLIQTNSVGEIEWDYAGEWMLPVLATRGIRIKMGDRLCQMLISPLPTAPWYIKLRHLFVTGYRFRVVETLKTNRGGFGSTDR